MKKQFFTTILLFLTLGQVWGESFISDGTTRFYITNKANAVDSYDWIQGDDKAWLQVDNNESIADNGGTISTGVVHVTGAIYYVVIPEGTWSHFRLYRGESPSTETRWHATGTIAFNGNDHNHLTDYATGEDWTGASWSNIETVTIYTIPELLNDFKDDSSNSHYWSSSKTVKANIQGGDSYWTTPVMSGTGKNYNGKEIYSCSFLSVYGGVKVIEFQLYNGEEYEGKYTYDAPTVEDKKWAANNVISGKIYTGYSGGSHHWDTYGRDITIYAIPEATEYSLSPAFDVSTHVLLANVKIGSTGDGEWLGVWPVFEKTAYQYNQKWIYKATVFAKYNVICRMEFHEKESVDGVTKSYYDYNPASEVSADDIDGKIFGGWVNEAHTWYDYVPDTYTVEEHTNGGRIWEDSVGSYTFGVGATLPTNVTKWGYDFDGWYDNSGLTGEPVTEIADDATGNKDYYAKWTSIAHEYPIALHPEFLAAQEGDIITVNVIGVHTSAAIYLQYPNGTNITNLSISSAGTYTFQLDDDAAAGIRTYGLLVTGNNYTFDDVDILYRKTIWSGSLSDNTGWAETAVEKSIFSGLSGGEFLGFNVTKLGDGASYHNYAMRADYVQQLSGSCTATGIAIKQLSAANVTAISDSEKSVDINAQYLDISNLYSYTHTRVYTVEEHTNGGKINADSIGSYTFGVSETLPTDVNKWGYKFDGWYDNSSLEGDAVTTITTSDYGNKEYWAKWTSIEETMLSGSHPEFLAAEEGDILVITVTNTQPRAQIYLQSTDRALCLGSKWIAGTGAGKHVIQLTAAGATALHTGVIVTGENYTRSSVELLYKKTIWSEGVADESGWTYKTISDRTGFAGIADGDYLGFTVTALYDKDNKDNQYFMQYNYNEFITSAGIDETGTYFEVVPSDGADKLTTGDKDLTIGAKNLTLSDLHRYLTTRDYIVTLNTNGGTINSGNVTSYTYQTGATLPTNVTRTNYTFMGWYDNSSFTGEPVTSITTSDLGDKEYWAKWTFIIYRTGDKEDESQIESFAGGTINTPIEYRMKVRELDQWYSLSLPFEVSAVQVIEDGVHYDIVPYYRPEVGGTYYLGHYVIRTPAKTSDFPISDFDNWKDPEDYDGFVPTKNKPYIILWHDSYFLNRYIAFIGDAGQTIPESITEGARPTKNDVVNVYGNDAMVNGSVEDGYTLEPDYGQGAWLREDKIGNSRTVLPFECYLRANAATTPIFKVVRKQDTTTDIDQIVNRKSSNRKFIKDGQLIIIRDNKMYNIMGMEVQK